MSAIASSADHLQYVDKPFSPEAISAAKSLITSELTDSSTTAPHPSLSTLRPIRFSDAINAEHDLLAQGLPRPKSIDTTRYEEPSAPTDTDTQAWHTALQRAHIASAYLDGRLENLGLLETYGKNAWLVGNSQLEDVLRDLERDVAAARTGLEDVQRERRSQQEAVAGEMGSLEMAWRTGVGRHIEVLAANERLRLEILERKRRAAA